MAKHFYEYVVDGWNTVAGWFGGGNNTPEPEPEPAPAEQGVDAVSSAEIPVTGVYPAGTGSTSLSGNAKGNGSGNGSNGSGGGYWDDGPWSPSPPDFAFLEQELKLLLDNIDQRIQLAINRGDITEAMRLQTVAQDRIAELVKTYEYWGYNESSTEVSTLLNKGYNYAGAQDKLYQGSLDELIKALKDLTEAANDAAALAEKQQAVENAAAVLENAQKQRSVRVFNAQTDQWEWIADELTVQNAQAKLAGAEEALKKEKLAQELVAVQNAINSGASADEITIGEELLALLTDAQESGGVFSGVGDIGTAGRLTAQSGEAAANAVPGLLEAIGALSGMSGSAPYVGGNALFNSSAGVDNSVNYTFGDITLSEAEAQSMTVAELAERLRELRLG